MQIHLDEPTDLHMLQWSLAILLMYFAIFSHIFWRRFDESFWSYYNVLAMVWKIYQQTLPMCNGPAYLGGSVRVTDGMNRGFDE